MAFRSIKAANKKIDEQKKEISILNSYIKQLKISISENENNVSAQDFCDMRLRAQKAELALEAMTQANINNNIQNNMRKAIAKEDIKANLLEELMIHLKNFKVN